MKLALQVARALPKVAITMACLITSGVAILSSAVDCLVTGMRPIWKIAGALSKVAVIIVCLIASGVAILLDLFILSKFKKG